MDFTPYTPGAPLTKAAPLDVAVPPGDTLREALDELHMSQVELAGRIGASTKHVNQIIKGVVPISADIAHRLDSVTGIPARMWTRMESDYQTVKAKKAREVSLAATVDWVKDMPVAAMVKAGALPAGRFSKQDRLDQVLRFFGIADIDAFSTVVPAAAFRKSATQKQNQFAAAAWLRLGEVAARDMDINDFNARALRASLAELRTLTDEDPSTALPRLVEIAAAAGVAVVFVPEVTGSRAYGATFWVNARRPVVLLSARGGTVDKFWETLFHELGHVILHDKKSVFIEDEEGDDEVLRDEQEAIAFSRDLLIPATEQDQLPTLTSEDDVSRFAEAIGVQSGIVLAELQRQGLWKFHQGNTLRRKLTVADLPHQNRAQLASVRPDRLRWEPM